MDDGGRRESEKEGEKKFYRERAGWATMGWTETIKDTNTQNTNNHDEQSQVQTKK